MALNKAWPLAYKELTVPGKVNNINNSVLISHRFLWECEAIGQESPQFCMFQSTDLMER